jgi:hypothetical protein
MLSVNYRNKFVAILLTLPLLLSIFAITPAVAVLPDSVTVDGVLTTDTYMLYPYQEKSISVGFSKYGEMIDYDEATDIGVGLQYPGYDSVGTYDQTAGTSRDAFANENILVKYWLNGWFIDIKYTEETLRDRNVWAFAMFSDRWVPGGDWLVGHPGPPDGFPRGGRKTNAYAETEDLEVLYDGPRKFVAQAVTHIYDWEDADTDGEVDHDPEHPVDNETWPLVDVTITMVFNKVKKYVIVFKDVKLKIDSKILGSPVDIQFSNRGEWDMGPDPNYYSYAHFYHQEMPTCYGPEWHMAPSIMREYFYINNTVSGDLIVLPEDIDDPTDPFMDPDYGLPVIQGSERVYVNGEFQEPGEDYNIDYNTGEIIFLYQLTSDLVEVSYKLPKCGLYEAGVPHLYDLAQIISGDENYVGWAAFWPILSDYTVDGWGRIFQPLVNVDQEDMVPYSTEPGIPFIIGEWDSMLDYEYYPQMFRGVTVYGMTDHHDANDEHMEDSVPEQASTPYFESLVVDREVKYQLDEVFRNWDLKKAVHKDHRRWVEWGYGPSIQLSNTPVKWVPDEEWDQYCTFSERVIDISAGYVLEKRPSEYSLSVDSDGVGHITGLDSGHYYKILYSTDTSWASQATYTATWSKWNNTLPSTGNAITLLVPGPTANVLWDLPIDPLGMDWAVNVENLSVTLRNVSQSGLTVDGTIFDEEIHQNYNNFKVFKEQTAVLRSKAWQYPDLKDYDSGLVVKAEFDRLFSTAEATVETVHVDWFHPDVTITVWLQTNGTHFNSTVTLTIMGEPGYPDYPSPNLYEEHVGGRYEWTVVGRDAASVDSVGAALVTAAFKNKQIEIGIAGLDMLDPQVANQIPWVMAKYGSGDEKEDYHYDNDGGDHRTALKDDWCTTWPISSSNMIFVGGPLANLGSYYFNDFTDALYGDGRFAGSAWSGKVATISCWNKNTYESSESTGYAVIGTYKDINGTVGLVIWGHWGRDTFYASKWFHDHLVYQLQEFPCHVDSIVVEIDYSDPEHPTFSIPECLGTISEREVHEKLIGNP